MQRKYDNHKHIPGIDFYLGEIIKKKLNFAHFENFYSTKSQFYGPPGPRCLIININSRHLLVVDNLLQKGKIYLKYGFSLDMNPCPTDIGMN